MATFGIQNLPAPPQPGTQQPVGDSASLLGPQLQAAQQAQRAAGMQEALRAMMSQFRDLAQTLDTLAGQHPEAATEFRTAQSALRNAAMKVTAKLTRNQDASMQSPVLA